MLVYLKGSRIAFDFVAEANGTGSIAAQLSAVTSKFSLCCQLFSFYRGRVQNTLDCPIMYSYVLRY